MTRSILWCVCLAPLAWACADGDAGHVSDAAVAEAGLVDAAVNRALPDATLDLGQPDAAADASAGSDADAAPEAAPDMADAGPSTLSCAEVFECAIACDPDRADCARACLDQASPEAQALALALAECTIAADTRGVDRRELCAAEFEACTGPDD